ncbi:MAG: saccharopine dehydrogenase NADP-binding domain-containing protein, partial [Rhodoferax sp.]|nr:saccharopine dehydrogenase NADP-binding domain-containing protein [Rhodoferax sp.]
MQEFPRQHLPTRAVTFRTGAPLARIQNAPMTKSFDLVIFGASGYTGRLVAEHLAHQAPPDLRWALAGRDASRLQAVHSDLQLPNAVACLTVDANDESSLRSLMAQTRLVITTVGPYQLYGSALVAACAQAGVDYVDL